jgi:hypothetical protein
MGEAVSGNAGMLSLFVLALVFFGLLIKDVGDNIRKYGKR